MSKHKKLTLLIIGTFLVLSINAFADNPDVIVGELDNMREYARTNDIVAMSVATTSCNAGDAVLKWEPLPSNQHPIITMNLYKLDNDRMEQIGQSWVKHGFFAVQADFCNLGCTPSRDGLGVGCSDPYSANLNMGPNLGSRSEINPVTGYFDGETVNQHNDDHNDGISHGLQVYHSELSKDEARYFVEGQYITPDDALAGNGTNNTSYREVSIEDNNGTWLVSNAGHTVREKPAIMAWDGAKFSIIDSPDDGRIIVASKAVRLDDGNFRHNYAVYNMNSDRGIRKFSIPVGNLAISNIGFKAVPSHGESWSNDEWSSEVNDGVVSWSTDSYQKNKDANAIRWGTTYNFWFDTNTANLSEKVTLEKFKPGDSDDVITASAGSAPILSGESDESSQELTEEGRLLVGRAMDYEPINEDPEVLFNKLKNSMDERRKFGWEIVEQMLRPHPVLLADGVTKVNIPMWQTWYEGTRFPNETQPLIELYFDKLKVDRTVNREELSQEALADFGQKIMSEALINERFNKVLLQFEDAETLPAEFEGRGNTIFSPSFMAHIMTEAKNIEECRNDIPADQEPPSDNNFSHCIKEFPRSAVMVKTTWENLSQRNIPNHITDAGVMKNLIVSGNVPGSGTWPRLANTENPDETRIYTNITKEGERWGLTGIHFVTKDVREWVWVTLWWSPNPRTDFGADMPESIKFYNNGVWQNYKMCVVSSFEEGDPGPWVYYTGEEQSLGDAIQATHLALKNNVAQPPFDNVTTWCSNPFIEFHQGNGRTSCIGCHQFSQTDIGFGVVLSDRVPQAGRSKFRQNFPADFAYSIPFEFLGERVIERARDGAGFEWEEN